MNRARKRAAVPIALRQIAAGVCAGVVACVAAPAVARSPSCEQVERYTLKNGLEVVLRPDHDLPNVAIVSSVHAGARNDPKGYEGLAHYVEHLTFREAQSLPSVLDLYKQAGATGLNGTTSLDQTNYFAQLPRAQIERGLWLEARRIAIGLDTLTAAPAEEEREVILREHEQRFGVTGLALQVATVQADALFPEGHPYHALGRPTESGQGALTLADARWFFARYYRPDRVRLTLVGDFEPDKVRPMIDKYFAALTAREAPAAPGGSAQTEAQHAAECKRAEQPGAPLHGSVRISWRLRYESMSFLWLAPTGDESERWWGVLDTFAQRVEHAVRDAKLASGVNLQLVQSELADYWVLTINLLPLQPFDRVPPLVSQVFAELKKSPLDAGEQTAERQSLELGQAQKRSLLSRAIDLSRRECHPSHCLTPSEQLSAETIASIDRFDPAKALRVELRHAAMASEDGDVERVP